MTKEAISREDGYKAIQKVACSDDPSLKDAKKRFKHAYSKAAHEGALGGMELYGEADMYSQLLFSAIMGNRAFAEAKDEAWRQKARAYLRYASPNESVRRSSIRNAIREWRACKEETAK